MLQSGDAFFAVGDGVQLFFRLFAHGQQLRFVGCLVFALQRVDQFQSLFDKIESFRIKFQAVQIALQMGGQFANLESQSLKLFQLRFLSRVHPRQLNQRAFGLAQEVDGGGRFVVDAGE